MPFQLRPRVRVGIAIYDADRILLVESESAGDSFWLIPGGGIDLGESLHDAAVREAREEVCLDVQPGRVLCVTEMLLDGESIGSHMVHIVFRAQRWQGTPAVGEDPDVNRVAWHPVSELRGLVLYPPIAEILVANAYGEAEQGPYINGRSAAWDAMHARVRGRASQP